ncbi:MAG: hypothetical protein PHQ72_02750 [Hespellia sp.]|nr:hypothetical protein [Hespellia sp.]
MGIMKNALRERIRRKDIYVIIAIGILIVMMCMSGAATLSVNGVAVTEFKIMMPLVLNISSVLGGAIAIALSLRTIPNEYERKTSHLVWIRGVSQWKYHSQLAMANVVSSLGALLILYSAVIVFAVMKGEMSVLVKGIPAFGLFAISTAAVSLFTSAISLVLPGMAAGVVCVGCMLAAIGYPVLETLSGILSGVARQLIRGVLFVMPDLYSVQQQASKLLLGKEIEIHRVLAGSLVIYFCVVLLYLIRKKEA